MSKSFDVDYWKLPSTVSKVANSSVNALWRAACGIFDRARGSKLLPWALGALYLTVPLSSALTENHDHADDHSSHSKTVTLGNSSFQLLGYGPDSDGGMPSLKIQLWPGQHFYLDDLGDGKYLYRGGANETPVTVYGTPTKKLVSLADNVSYVWDNILPQNVHQYLSPVDLRVGEVSWDMDDNGYYPSQRVANGYAGHCVYSTNSVCIPEAWHYKPFKRFAPDRPTSIDKDWLHQNWGTLLIDELHELGHLFCVKSGIDDLSDRENCTLAQAFAEDTEHLTPEQRKLVDPYYLKNHADAAAQIFATLFFPGDCEEGKIQMILPRTTEAVKRAIFEKCGPQHFHDYSTPESRDAGRPDTVFIGRLVVDKDFGGIVTTGDSVVREGNGTIKIGNGTLIGVDTAFVGALDIGKDNKICSGITLNGSAVPGGLRVGKNNVIVSTSFHPKGRYIVVDPAKMENASDKVFVCASAGRKNVFLVPAKPYWRCRAVEGAKRELGVTPKNDPVRVDHCRTQRATAKLEA